MSDDYERVILVKPDVFIYKIPPRSSNRGYRASDWKLDEPDWTGRLRVIAKGSKCILKLELKENGQLFAECPIDKYPGPSIESVSDSSRYFVLRIVSPTGQAAFIGMGFADRGDSFDLNVALQDHFKIIEKEREAEKETAEDSGPKLDLKFKEGETIKVNLNIAKKSSTSRPKTSKPAGTGILLPPPPGAARGATTTTVPGISSSDNDAEDGDDFGMEKLSVGPSTTTSAIPSQPSSIQETTTTATTMSADGWAQF